MPVIDGLSLKKTPPVKSDRRCFLLTQVSKLRDVDSLGPLGALNHVILNLIILIERLEALHVQACEMHEYIITVLIGNESVTFLIVEPLDCSLVH